MPGSDGGRLAAIQAAVAASQADGYLAVSLTTAQARWLVDTVSGAARLVATMREHLTVAPDNPKGCVACVASADLFLQRCAE